MTALLGKGCLFIGFAALGFLRGIRLSQRTSCLEEFHRILAALSRELTFSLRSVSDLIATAAAGSKGQTAEFFKTCLHLFEEGGRESWAESWSAALDVVQLPLEQADRRLLREAGDVLGRYDGESQHQAFAGLLCRLEQQREEARQNARRLFRVYVALGVTAGLFCLILL